MATQHKILEKLWDNIVKQTFTNNGWQYTSGFNYKSLNNHLYTFSIIKHRNKPNTISANLGVKFIPLDDILWAILSMENNSKARFSLRVNGSFSLSPKSIKDWQQEISLEDPLEDFAGIFKTIDNLTNQYSEKLVNLDTFLAFVLSMGQPQNVKDKNLYLTGLIYKNRLKEAVDFLKENMQTETGGFYDGSKSFYELALQYCQNTNSSENSRGIPYDL